MFRRVRRYRGFTLIELLVVIAIIAFLVAILLPSFAGAQSLAASPSNPPSVAATSVKARNLVLIGPPGPYVLKNGTPTIPIQTDKFNSAEIPSEWCVEGSPVRVFRLGGELVCEAFIRLDSFGDPLPITLPATRSGWFDPLVVLTALLIVAGVFTPLYIERRRERKAQSSAA